MEDLLKEIMKKLDDLEQRISQIEEDLYMPGDDAENGFIEMETVDGESLPKAVAILNSVDKITIDQMQRFLNCGYARSVRIMKQLDAMGLVSLDTVGNYFTVNKNELEEYIRQHNEEAKWN